MRCFEREESKESQIIKPNLKPHQEFLKILDY